MYVLKFFVLKLIDRIRLINGSNQGVGRVEVYITTIPGDPGSSGWGTICDDNWDIQDARVVCHQLGYLDALAAPLSAYYGEGSERIWFDNMHCIGTEPDLFACMHNGIGEHDCDHSEDASVECLGICMY